MQGAASGHYFENYVVIELLKNPDVIGITVTKQTPNEYFKTVRKENDYGTDH